MPIVYMKIDEIAQLVNAGDKYTKTAKTLLRTPRPEEVGQTLVTYIKALPGSTDEYTEESKAVIDSGSVIAENIRPVAEGVKNTWVIGWNDVKLMKVYNVDRSGLSTTPAGFLKTEEITAIKITPEVVALFRKYNSTAKSADGEHEYILIQADWDPDVTLTAAVGGYITASGQPISEENMLDYTLTKELAQTNSTHQNPAAVYREKVSTKRSNQESDNNNVDCKL